MIEEPVAATKDRPGTYDAIETAKPGEPLFPVQGGDPFGPPTVLFWVELARAAGRAEPDPKKAERLLRKATDAEMLAWKMQAYQRGHVEVPETRASYSDDPLQIDASDHGRAVRTARIKGAEQLHSLVGHGMAVADILAALDACPDEVAALRGAVEQIKAIAQAIEPRRGNERS